MEKLLSKLKKGQRVLMSYGEQNGDMADCGTFERWTILNLRSSFKPWEGTLMDNKKNGNTRYVKVEGFGTDIGDVYAWQIMGWWNEEKGMWSPVKHTDKQLAFKKTVEEFGF